VKTLVATDRAEQTSRAVPRTVRLLITCPDRPGIVASVANFLFDSGANITRSDQYSTDPTGGTFFMRLEFAIDGRRSVGIAERFARAVAPPFDMSWRMWDSAERKRVAIMVSKHDHCLLDLLWRWRRRELEADIVAVVSNHPDLRDQVRTSGLPYHHVAVTPETKAAAERRLRKLLVGRCDLIVLARYMQILSGRFLEDVRVPVINIHHSFLPAFAGASPYEQAKERGVKLIGATAHYVTEELDAGPIIEQDVIRVSHQDDVRALTQRGADIERAVLARAVQWHCQDRVLRHHNTTVVL
jgi:formyltetrahydrofolate deformylase